MLFVTLGALGVLLALAAVAGRDYDVNDTVDDNENDAQLEAVLSELESEDAPSGGLIAKALGAVVGTIGGMFKGPKAKLKPEDDEEDEGLEDEDGDLDDDADMDAEDDDEDEDLDDEGDEGGYGGDDNDDEDIAAILEQYGLSDKKAKGKDAKGKPPVRKSVVDIADEEIPDIIGADELVKGLLGVFDVALDERDRELRRFMRKQIDGLRKAIGDNRQTLPDPRMPVHPAPAVSPHTALLARQFDTPPVAPQGPADGIAVTMEKALIARVISAAEATSLQRAFGTDDWSDKHALRLSEIEQRLSG